MKKLLLSLGALTAVVAPVAAVVACGDDAKTKDKKGTEGVATATTDAFGDAITDTKPVFKFIDKVDYSGTTPVATLDGQIKEDFDSLKAGETKDVTVVNNSGKSQVFTLKGGDDSTKEAAVTYASKIVQVVKLGSSITTPVTIDFGATEDQAASLVFGKTIFAAGELDTSAVFLEISGADVTQNKDWTFTVTENDTVKSAKLQIQKQDISELKKAFAEAFTNKGKTPATKVPVTPGKVVIPKENTGYPLSTTTGYYDSTIYKDAAYGDLIKAIVSDTKSTIDGYNKVLDISISDIEKISGYKVGVAQDNDGLFFFIYTNATKPTIIQSFGLDETSGTLDADLAAKGIKFTATDADVPTGKTIQLSTSKNGSDKFSLELADK